MGQDRGIQGTFSGSIEPAIAAARRLYRAPAAVLASIPRGRRGVGCRQGGRYCGQSTGLAVRLKTAARPLKCARPTHPGVSRDVQRAQYPVLAFPPLVAAPVVVPGAMPVVVPGAIFILFCA